VSVRVVMVFCHVRGMRGVSGERGMRGESSVRV